MNWVLGKKVELRTSNKVVDALFHREEVKEMQAIFRS